MPNINLSILNQRQTPAFFADTLANRPAPSFVGRIFISTDTLDLYRDTGTAWLLLSPSSTGTITGSGAAGQVTYFSAASSITGNNNLFWDTANNRLGINTNTPGASIDVHSANNSIAQFNQTTATNNSLLVLQNSGSALWRLGNYYNAGANDFGVFDVVGAIQPITIKKTTGQTFIGLETTSSGKLVVNQTASDQGIVVLGTTAPSIRVRNAGTNPTQQFGLGLSTGVNNFIQGSASGDFCIFNGSSTASPITFGIYDAVALNNQEAARISAARNFIVGSSVDAGYKFDVNGSGRFTGVLYADNTIRVGVGIIGTSSNNLALSSNTTGGEISFWNNQLANRLMTLTGAGSLGIGTATPGYKLDVSSTASEVMRLRGTNGGSTNNTQLRFYGSASATDLWAIGTEVSTGTTDRAFDFYDLVAGANRMRISNAGNLLLNKSVDSGQKLQVQGTITGTQYLGNYIVGIDYPQTSSSGGTSIIDTGIYTNTTSIGYSVGSVYMICILGNPNAGGLSQYRNIYTGYIYINTGYNGGNPTTYINYQQLITGTASGIGGFTISAVFWNGTSEVSDVTANDTTTQIRIKVTGYASFTGAYQEVKVTKIL